MEKIALVTGSSRGIGRAVAAELARQGWAVCINYRVREDCARSLLEQLTAEGCRAMMVRADVSQRDQVEAMVRRVEDTFGPVSLLVNNAGVAGQALFQDISEELWRRYFSVNVDGAFHTIQAVLPHMLHQHAGCIVNISSIWGQRGASCEVTYSCTKAALIGLTRSLAMELAPTHIRVNCVAPGVIRTDMLDALPPEVLPQLAQETPLGRLGTPEDIAHAVAFLAGDGAVFQMTDALSRRQTDKAFSVLTDLLRLQQAPIMILAVLGKHFRQLYTARVALESGKGSRWVMELWGMRSPYPADKLLEGARHHDLAWCKTAMRRCAETDLAMKSVAGADGKDLLVSLLLELSAGGAPC